MIVLSIVSVDNDGLLLRDVARRGGTKGHLYVRGRTVANFVDSSRSIHKHSTSGKVLTRTSWPSPFNHLSP